MAEHDALPGASSVVPTLVVSTSASDESTLRPPSSDPAAPDSRLPIGQSVTRGALALLSTQPLTWAASLLSAVLIPRLLGADALGQLAIAMTVASFASTATGLGISEFLVRRVAQHPQTLRRDAGVALCVQLAVTVLGVLLIAVGARFMEPTFVEYPLLMVALLPTLAAPVQTVLLSSFRGSERHRSYAWFTAATLISSTLGGLLVLFLGGGVVAFTATSGVLTIASTLLAWKLYALRPQIRLTRSLVPEAVEFIRGGFPFLSLQLTQVAYGQIDKVLMGAFVPAAEVGWYAAAGRIIGIVVFIPTLVISPLFPALSRSAHDSTVIRRTIAQTMRVLIILMVGMTVGTVVIAPIIPSLFHWPADFQGAVPLMTILALQEPIVATDMVLGVVLMSIHREGRWVLIGIAATVFNVVANLVLVPWFQNQLGNGAIGASVITVLTEVLMLFGALFLIPRNLLDAAILPHAGRVVLAGVIAALVGLALLPIAIWASVPVAGLTYVVGIVLLRAVTAHDLEPARARLALLRR